MRPLNFYEWNRRENKARKIDADADDKLLHSLTVGCRDCSIDKQGALRRGVLRFLHVLR
jgi:hypothetical protein